MQTELGHYTTEAGRIELRPRRGAFGFFHNNRWLPFRRPDPDKPAEDLTIITADEAWAILGSLDYVNHDAVRHHFGVPWTRGHGVDRQAVTRRLAESDFPGLNGV